MYNETTGTTQTCHPFTSELVRSLELRAGMVVAVLGSHTNLPLSELLRDVAPERRASVVIVSAHRLVDETSGDSAMNDADRAGCTTERSWLPKQCCDVVLLASGTISQPSGQDALIEARRLLREHGRLVLWNIPGPSLKCESGASSYADSMRQAIYVAEMNCWSLMKLVERPEGYLLIFEVTDESVTS